MLYVSISKSLFQFISKSSCSPETYSPRPPSAHSKHDDSNVTAPEWKTNCFSLSAVSRNVESRSSRDDSIKSYLKRASKEIVRHCSIFFVENREVIINAVVVIYRAIYFVRAAAATCASRVFF